MTLDETILQNLLIERELCIAKLRFVTQRLERLEELIVEQRKKIQPNNIVDTHS